MKPHSKRRTWLLLAVILSLSGFVRMKAETLSPNTPIERSIAPGAVNSFEVTLHKGDFIQLTVEQPKPNVVVTVITPAGEQQMSASGFSLSSFKLAFIAKAEGGFRFDVQTLGRSAPNSSYRLILDSPHTATASDEKLAQASNALHEANRWFARVASEMNSSEPLAANAIEKYQQALKLIALLDDREAEAGAYYHLGVSYLAQNDSEDAVEFFTSAARLYESVGNWKAEAAARRSVIVTNTQRGYYHDAKTAAEALIGRAKEKGDAEMQVAALNLLYQALNNARDSEGAIETELRLLSLEPSQNTASAATYFENIAGNYLTLHEPRTSIAYRMRAVSIYENLKLTKKLATALGRIASDYGRIGEIPLALEFSKKAIALDPSQIDANLLMKVGKTAQAIESIRQKIETLHDQKKPEEAAWLALTSFYMQANQRSSALDALEQALNAWPEGERPDGRIDFLAAVAKVYENLGESRTALGLFQEYLRLVQAKGAEGFRQHPNNLGQMARSERDLEMLDQAREHLISALDLSRQARSRIANPELGASYFADSRTIFGIYIDVLMRQHARAPQEGYDVRAFEVSEEARAHALIANLADSISRIREGVDPQLIEQERRLQDRINEGAMVQSSPGATGRAQAAQYKLGQLTAELGLLRATIRKSSPAYASLTEPVALTLPEIRARVLEPGTTLLEFSLSDFADSYVWELTTDSLRSMKLPSRTTVEAAARRVRELLLERERRPKSETSNQRKVRLDKADKDLSLASAALGKMLLGPLGGIPTDQRLLIVTDGALDFIPFSMLREPQTGVSLIANHEIVRLPSASALAVIRESIAARRPMSRRDIAILADPVFSAQDERLSSALRSGNTVRPEALNRSITESGLTLPRLSFSSREARAIASVATKEKAVVKLGIEANRNFATSSELGNFRIVHFATHGLLNTEVPALSGIVLSLVDKQGKPQDGFLRLHDIYNLHLNADLVVLSACQTALGEQVMGEGAISLSRGFFYAGAAGVVASLWTVNDSATEKLMTAFYRNMLSRNMKPAAALRAAQMEMHQAGEPPYNWAAFELQGEWK